MKRRRGGRRGVGVVFEWRGKIRGSIGKNGRRANKILYSRYETEREKV